MNDFFFQTCFKQVILPEHEAMEGVRNKSASGSMEPCVCARVHVKKFLYKPGRAEAATDISSEFAYSWLNLHLAMQMYANIVSEHFKNRNQHSKRCCAF